MSKSTLLRFAAGLLLAGGAACSRTIIVTYHPGAPPPRTLDPRPPAAVEFRTRAPTRPYTVVGIVQWQPEDGTNQDRVRDVMARMRERAGQAGCDGVVWLGKNDALVPVVEGSGVWTQVTMEPVTGYRMSCYVYNQAPAAAWDEEEGSPARATPVPAPDEDGPPARTPARSGVSDPTLLMPVRTRPTRQFGLKADVPQPYVPVNR